MEANATLQELSLVPNVVRHFFIMPHENLVLPQHKKPPRQENIWFGDTNAIVLGQNKMRLKKYIRPLKCCCPRQTLVDPIKKKSLFQNNF
jgi:hypothetical protein